MENLRREQEPEQQEQEKVVITLPQDNEVLVKQLEKKLEEYEERQERSRVAAQDERRKPEERAKSADFGEDARYKSIVLKKLLTEGNVDSMALSEEMTSRLQAGEIFDPDRLSEAIEVIRQYITNPENPEVREGTGLPKTESALGVEVPRPLEGVKKPTIEVVERLGHVRTEQEIEEYRKIREGAERQIEAKKAADARLEEIRRKQENGELLTAVEVGLLNTEQQREEQREKALKVLSDPEVMGRKPREILEAFREVTEDARGEHRHLAQERNEMVESNFRERGMTVIKGREAIERYRQRATRREEKTIQTEERSRAIMICWDRLSPEEQGRYMEKGIVDLGRFKDHLSERAEKLGISEDELYSLARAGYNIEQTEKRGFFGRLLSGAIKVVRGDLPQPVDLSKKEFSAMIAEIQREEAERTSKEAQRRVGLKIIRGKKMLLAERTVCTKKIIGQTVEEYNLEKQEAEQRAQIERRKKTREESEQRTTEKKKEKSKRAEKKKTPERKVEKKKRKSK